MPNYSMDLVIYLDVIKNIASIHCISTAVMDCIRANYSLLRFLDVVYIVSYPNLANARGS